jgi:hypothetical protein
VGPDRFDTADPAAAIPSDEVAPDAWTTGIVTSPSTVAVSIPVVTAIRIGRHEAFERVTLELSGDGTGIPSYHVGYVDKPLHECGSGAEIHPVGEGWLEIRIQDLDAHTQEGQPTVSHRPQDTDGLDNMRRLYMTCDFEAVVTVVVAVGSPNPFRAFHAVTPRRIVVDVQK